MKAGVIEIKSYILKTAVLLLFIGLVYFFFPYQEPDDIKSFVSGFGASAPIAFIIICAVKPIIFFLPSMGLTIIAGALFGTIYGTLYVVIGGAGSTVIGFYMTRWFGRKCVEGFMKEQDKLLKIDENLGKEGFRTTLMLRLLSTPWDIVSYSAGLSKIRFKDFYLASLIALAPTSFIYTYFGSSVFNPLSLGFIVSLSMILIFGSIPYVIKRYGTKNY